MPTITVIGAGSMVFARNLISDVLSFEALDDSTLVLMDIDEQRLDETATVANRMVDRAGLDATIQATTDRREALKGVDYVINLINVGGTEPFENEIEIPRKYGVKQAIGDTLGPGGVFRGLRTVPAMLDIASDMEELCPDALFLNYTNPMAILCWTMYEETEIDTVGLCHSVPHTASAIAEYVGAPAEELEYWVAGINHMAWFLECAWNGEDVYPMLEEAMTDPETYEKDTVRFELLDHFGAFVTESSHHLSEYLPYFRTDQGEIDRLTGTQSAGRMPTATYLEGWKERSQERDEAMVDVDPGEVEIERSEEYASRLIHSIETDTPRRLNLNVSNETDAIRNLPSAACVEVPCLVDGTGVRPCSVGELPSQLVSLIRTNVNVQQLAVEGIVEGDREAIHRAIKLDPLTAAACTLSEAHEMTEELLAANEEYLPELT